MERSGVDRVPPTNQSSPLTELGLLGICESGNFPEAALNRKVRKSEQTHHVVQPWKRPLGRLRDGYEMELTLEQIPS